MEEEKKFVRVEFNYSLPPLHKLHEVKAVAPHCFETSSGTLVLSDDDGVNERRYPVGTWHDLLVQRITTKQAVSLLNASKSTIKVGKWPNQNATV